MSVTELLPILQKLSRAEKLSILEFLQADLDLGRNSLTSSDSIQPYLRRKEDILVIETGSLEHIDFNQFIDQLRESNNFM